MGPSSAFTTKRGMRRSGSSGAPHPCCIRMTDEYLHAKPCEEICSKCPL